MNAWRPQVLRYACRCGHVTAIDRDEAGALRCGDCGEALDTAGEVQPFDGQVVPRWAREVPVLVALEAPWCDDPLRRRDEVLDGVGRRHAGELVVVRADVAERPDLPDALGADDLPAFALWRAGGCVAVTSGVRSATALEAFLLPWLG